MARGYDRTLYFLPFDHRGFFETNMFGSKGTGSDRDNAL
jgi:hypothetical protein